MARAPAVRVGDRKPSTSLRRRLATRWSRLTVARLMHLIYDLLLVVGRRTRTRLPDNANEAGIPTPGGRRGGPGSSTSADRCGSKLRVEPLHHPGGFTPFG